MDKPTEISKMRKRRSSKYKTPEAKKKILSEALKQNLRRRKLVDLNK